MKRLLLLLLLAPSIALAQWGGLYTNRSSSSHFGQTPTMGACGTAPSVVGNDQAMLVTVGTGGSATTCAVTFNAAFTNAPICIAQNDTDRVAYSMATTTTTVTVSAAAAFTASSKFHIICRGYE